MILIERQAVLQSLAKKAQKLPPNLAGQFNPTDLQTIFRQMFSDMVWPQITARLPFEEKWNRLQKMYEVSRNEDRKRSRQRPETTTPHPNGEDRVELADTIIFDTVDRLKNLNYFIAWKDQPVQYNRPRHTYTPLEDEFYNPTTRKLRSANAVLDWNNELQKVRSKHLKLSQHHYLYGISFVYSDFVLDIDTDASSQDYLLITNIGTSFEPISIRKLWLNNLLPIDQMEKQVCPFYFDLVPRAKLMANVYHPQLNPFGFVNLDKLEFPQYLFGPESKSFSDGLPEEVRSTLTQLRPEFSGEALWTFYPLLNLPGTQTTERYIVQCYANNLFAGAITPIRIQKCYYPRQRLPLYGCSHIPDLDSGLYTPSIGSILESHYDEIVRAKEQFILNKDWINNPPTEVASGSPAANVPNLNAPGIKYEVNSVNDVNRRQPYDATQTTLVFIQQTRDAAQTSGKAVDAILGKAMGGRTTATEASNAFQASMSGVTADVDHFTLSHYGQYALRVWENAGAFIPKVILDKICGNSESPPISEQDFAIQIGIKTDVGSTFIESIVKQQHLQQAIASATASPFLDQPTLWKALFRELKLTEAIGAVKDNGFEFQVSLATEQACETYRGMQVMIDPSQDHQIALRVKTKFLQDTKSVYNTEMASLPSPVEGLTVAQYLAQQIQIHQQFVMIQMQQQMQMQLALAQDEQIARLPNGGNGIKPSHKNDNPQPNQ